jgi:hypothetical protein
MNGQDFKAWRTSFDLTQADVADRFGVTRTTVQNWEALPGPLPNAVNYGLTLWTRTLKQAQPLRGPVTLNYSDGPLFIQPFGPRRPLAMLHQETHPNNAAVLARVQVLAGADGMFNPFVLEEGAHDLWNIVELQRVMVGEDSNAPTLPNMVCRLAAGIRADAPYYVRSGARMATSAEQDKRMRELEALAVVLDSIGKQTMQEVVGQQANIEGIMQQVQTLGLRLRNDLVSGIASACHAARSPL